MARIDQGAGRRFPTGELVIEIELGSGVSIAGVNIISLIRHDLEAETRSDGVVLITGISSDE